MIHFILDDNGDLRLVTGRSLCLYVQVVSVRMDVCMLCMHAFVREGDSVCCVCVCVCVRECVMCVFMCVQEPQRERERLDAYSKVTVHLGIRYLVLSVFMIDIKQSFDPD